MFTDVYQQTTRYMISIYLSIQLLQMFKKTKEADEIKTDVGTFCLL